MSYAKSLFIAMGCRSSVVYTLFSFPEIQCVYQVIKLLIVHLKKKKRNGTGTDGRHSLTQFREIHEC